MQKSGHRFFATITLQAKNLEQNSDADHMRFALAETRFLSVEISWRLRPVQILNCAVIHMAGIFLNRF